MVDLDKLFTLAGYTTICLLTVLPVAYAATRVEDANTRRIAMLVIPLLVTLCISIAVVISL